ncbi:MAG TPA: kelch repeat-containing protein [Candidatus Binataceae bacterium]|nr:kelch repeat-containing protein [Candidatus Binataceae bacterium]
MRASISILARGAAALLALLAAAALCGCTNPIAEPPIVYTNRLGERAVELAMAMPRADQAAVALKDGRVLICGGTFNGEIDGVTPSAEIYDPLTHRFTPTGSMSVARMGQTATLLNDGRVLIAGGVENFGFRSELASAELYDPASRRFVPTGSMSVEREGHTATLLRDGRVLVAGGSDNGAHTLSSAEIYDPETGRWRLTGRMNVPREAQVAVRLGSGQVLMAAGGRGDMPGGYIAYQNAEIFDPGAGKFHSLAARMKSDRVGAAAVLLGDGRALIVGGKTGRILIGFHAQSLYWFTPLNTAEIFDPETATFTATLPMREPHYLAVATMLPGGDVLITGGWLMNGPVIGGMTDAEVFIPGLPGSFASVAPLHVARLQNTATELPGGEVLIAGGFDAQGAVTSAAEFYSPATRSFSRAGVAATPAPGAGK